MNDNEKIWAEHDRWCKKIKSNDSSLKSATTLGVDEALKAHFLLVEHFTEINGEIGGVGPKSMDLLISSLHRAHVSIGNEKKWKTKYEIIATTLFGLIKNHPFHDANKRTAFLCTIHLLRKNKLMLTAKSSDFEDFLVEISEGGIEHRKRYKEFTKNSKDPEVMYIAFWLRKNTRELKKERHTITFRELQRILKRNDYDLINPQNNRIDVVKYKKSRFSKKITVTKLGTVGFPGLAKQVQPGDLKWVRELTGLTDQNGFDSQTFYEGEGNFYTLIAKYEAPLRRLANR